MSKPDPTTHLDSHQSDGKPARSKRRFVTVGSAIAVLTAFIASTALVIAHGRDEHHLEHFLGYVLSDISATGEQKAQITSIIQTAARDVHVMHDQHDAALQQLKESLSSASVDRSRLETLRADHIRFADEASKRMLTALADAADVLTPEQRAAAAQKVEKKHRRSWRGDGH